MFKYLFGGIVGYGIGIYHTQNYYNEHLRQKGIQEKNWLSISPNGLNLGKYSICQIDDDKITFANGIIKIDTKKK